MGERESTMANAGITSPTGAASFYNPANLTRVPHASISMSGTTLMSFELEADAFLLLEGQDIPFEANGFVTIPTSLISTHRFGDWSLATAVLVPSVLELDDRSTFEVGALDATMLINSRSQDLWLGASVAHPLSERVALGLSVFGVQRDESNFTHFRISSSLLPGSVAESNSRTRSRVRGITAVIGLSWSAGSRVVLGARLQTPLVRISGEADIYQTQVGSGQLDTAEVIDRQNVNYDAPLPWDTGVGVAYLLLPALELVFDVNLQWPASFREDLEQGPEEILNAALRASAAVEVTATPSLGFQLGVLYNGSAATSPDEAGEVREAYVGMTVGVAWKVDRTRTSIGGFAMRSSGEMVPLGDDTTRTVDVSSRLIGGLLSVAYDL